MKSIQFRRNITIILSTLVAVILLYFLYTQVYTKIREENLIQTRFRVLDQMGENLRAKVDSYRKNAENFAGTVIHSKNVISTTGVFAKEQAIETSRSAYNSVYNEDLNFIKSVLKDTLESNNFSIRNDSVIFSSNGLQFYLPGEFLLKNIERKDIFAKSLIINDSSILYCSFSKDLKLAFINSAREEKKGKSLGLISSGRSDTLYLPVKGKLNAATIQDNRCYDIILSDGPYKLFLKPVKIDQYELFLGGLVKKTDFQREKQSIAPWMIIILSLVLLLIILSLPFVQLKVMSFTETLGTKTVVFSALALLLGTSFLIFYIFFRSIIFPG